MIHHDYVKEQRWARPGPPGQLSVRQMAHDYATTLLDEADFLLRLLRLNAK